MKEGREKGGAQLRSGGVEGIKWASGRSWVMDKGEKHEKCVLGQP